MNTKSLIFTTLLFFALIISSGCTELFVEPTPIPTETPTITPTPSPTNTPLPTETPTSTPTPAPLSAKEVFELVSPSVAFIETDIATGSGILISKKYVLTNAHVVYPYQSVRVVFPDGTEFLDVPVAGTDLVSDLAVLGPVDTDLMPFELTDGESLDIGSETLLIGYPGESEKFPQPSIVRGIISRIREWEKEKITYFQTDANVAGGQSGGVMVSEMGEVIGITGFAFTEVNYGLVASAKDLITRVDEIIENGYISELGDRAYNLEDARRRHSGKIEDFWHIDLYLLQISSTEDIELSLTTAFEAEMYISDPFGSYQSLEAIDSDLPDEQKFTFSPAGNGYYILEIYSYEDNAISYTITSSTELVKIEDADDHLTLDTETAQILGSIDYPGDYDYFQIDLEQGSEINIKADSVLIDTYVSIEHKVNERIERVGDDDSGQGLFSLNSEFSYLVPEDGTYYIVVSDAVDQNTGGYYLSVKESSDEVSVTPIAPEIREPDLYEEITTADPEETEVGLLRTYFHPTERLLIQYPADWELVDSNSDSEFSVFCVEDLVTDCLVGDEEVLVIAIEDLSIFNGMNMEEYLELVKDNLSNFLEITGERSFITTSGEEGVVIEAVIGDNLIIAKRFVFIKGDIAYNATYLFSEEISEAESQMIEYTFQGARVVPENE